jgi:dihydrofolate reductase
MRKVILGVAVSLDGFIEGQNGEYDWCPPPSKNEMDDFMEGVDAIFMGRRSFELMGPSAFPGKQLYIFSNTLKDVEGVQLVNGDVVSYVNDLRDQSGKNIWLFGGASLTTTFLNEGLIDEMWLGIVPIVLGGGKPLFQNTAQRKYFNIQEMSQKEGYLSVTLKYEPKATAKTKK